MILKTTWIAGKHPSSGLGFIQRRTRYETNKCFRCPLWDDVTAAVPFIYVVSLLGGDWRCPCRHLLHGPSAGAAGGNHPQPRGFLHWHYKQIHQGPHAQDHHASYDQQRERTCYALTEKEGMWRNRIACCYNIIFLCPWKCLGEGFHPLWAARLSLLIWGSEQPDGGVCWPGPAEGWNVAHVSCAQGGTAHYWWHQRQHRFHASTTPCK